VTSPSISLHVKVGLLLLVGEWQRSRSEHINLCLLRSTRIARIILGQDYIYKTTSDFVGRGNITLSMMRADHIYSENLSIVLHENLARTKFHYVRKFTRDLGEFKELANP
jgi:hypothetical protein